MIETAWCNVHKKTAKEFSNSKFKSADGTFKITPKLFLSSNDIYGPNWGVYVNCMMGVMTRNNDESYGILLTLHWEALQAWKINSHWYNDSSVQENNSNQ